LQRLNLTNSKKSLCQNTGLNRVLRSPKNRHGEDPADGKVGRVFGGSLALLPVATVFGAHPVGHSADAAVGCRVFAGHSALGHEREALSALHHYLFRGRGRLLMIRRTSIVQAINLTT
jgi:hypothetical protein